MLNQSKQKAAWLFALLCLVGPSKSNRAQAQDSIVDESLVFAEKDGLVAVEAEHFFKQTNSDIRAFYLTHGKQSPNVGQDGDPNHSASASGGAYLEILPDTRRTHADKLTRNENFCPDPGKMAVLHYKVNIKTAGRYYVWVRAYSTGSEDNGLHVGIDGNWPDSGQRLQWCEGKKSWRWDSKQRTEKQHCGDRYKIYLDIEPGEHTISFSMREDGFEFDKWLMTTNRDFERPTGTGPQSVVSSGTTPAAFAIVETPVNEAAKSPKPPTKKKIAAKKKMAAKEKMAGKAQPANQMLVMPAKMFADGKVKNYYVDQGKWLAINPDKAKSGSAERTFPFATGVYDAILRAVGENDGQSTYTVSIDGEKIGDHTCPMAKDTFEEGRKFHKTWKNISITDGAIIGATSTIASADGMEYSRARWSGIAFKPADEATRKAAVPYLTEQAASSRKVAKKNSAPQSSPTKSVSDLLLQMPRKADGSGRVSVGGEFKVWHKITIDVDGPYAHEKDNAPNPFTDYRMLVQFSHPDGSSYTVPGYFAADGNAANTSAEEGTTWRAHFAADRVGDWTYDISFEKGALAALDSDANSEALSKYDGKRGIIVVKESNKSGRDLRAHGRLKYVGNRYLQFAGSKKFFLKAGADAPETLLAFADFDDTIAGNAKKAPIKTWSDHVQDWNDGDPTWQGGKGKGLIGAVNYLSGKGCNAFSFLTYNAGGDGDNVWPFIQREDKLHYDCSKLDQWATLFEHGTHRGMYLHFKMQETEMDDNNRGTGNKSGLVPTSLDGGNLGTQRKLYCRELIARFGHNLALNWNLGEENTQTTKQIKDMINYIADTDAYDHNIVIHTFPTQQDKVYKPLLGDASKLTGTSLQNSSLSTTHAQTLKWVKASTDAGKPWVVAFDESGSAAHAQCPDLGYRGFDGHDSDGKYAHTQHEVRKQTLWGTLMAGGTGCEYYFGYKFAENDIVCEDWRSRDQSWDYCQIALNFFHDNQIPFWEMDNADELVGNPESEAGKFCLAKSDSVYVIYLPEGGAHSIDLSETKATFDISWFNPRTGGGMEAGSETQASGGAPVSLGTPPSDPSEDWVVVLKKK